MHPACSLCIYLFWPEEEKNPSVFLPFGPHVSLTGYPAEARVWAVRPYDAQVGEARLQEAEAHVAQEAELGVGALDQDAVPQAVDQQRPDLRPRRNHDLVRPRACRDHLQ